MEPIVSGTTTERIIRTSLVFLVLAGFALYYFRDGYYGYPNANLREFLASLGIADHPAPPIDPTLTMQRAGELAGELRGRPFAQVQKSLGPPGLAHENQRCYFGPASRLCLTLTGDLVTEAAVAQPTHSEADLRAQKGVGWLLALIATAFGVQLVRVLATRVSLTDAGLRIRGHSLIPFEALTGIRADRYMKSGWLELDFVREGQPASVRLDNYVIREFRPIIEKICEHRGFTNPLPPRPQEPAGENPNIAGLDERRH